VPPSPETSTTWHSPVLSSTGDAAGFRFPPSPDKLSQSARVHSLEAAFEESRSQCSPRSHRIAYTPEVLRAEV